MTPVSQGAYGILVEVESHPFPTDAMLFMDWRDDHTAANPDMQQSNRWVCHWDGELPLTISCS